MMLRSASHMGAGVFVTLSTLTGSSNTCTYAVAAVLLFVAGLGLDHILEGSKNMGMDDENSRRLYSWLGMAGARDQQGAASHTQLTQLVHGGYAVQAHQITHLHLPPGTDIQAATDAQRTNAGAPQ